MAVRFKEDTASTAKRTWGDFTAKRSEAMPTTSLFGSSLERQNEKQREDMKNIDLKSTNLKSQGAKKIHAGERIRLPESAEILNQQKEVLAQQHLEAIQARKTFEEVEQQRKTFSANIDQAEVTEKPNSQRSTNKWTRSDLENATMLNNVGYNNGRSFNHHKYKPKPPQHQYALIGDALQTGGDIVVDRDDYKRYPDEVYMKQPLGRRKKPLPNITPKIKSPSTEVLGVEDLPPNIRHYFGTKVCKQALADPELVRQSWQETRKKDARSSHNSLKPLTSTDLEDAKMDPNYETIGLTTRQNIFPGYTYDHKVSHMKTVHSPDVHQRRQPDPDQWRHCKDELAIWNEHDNLNKRMRKHWGEYEDNLPKHQPNWDRNAKRPPKPPERIPPPRPQPKPNRKKDIKEPKKMENDLVFEDIEFITPPLTPLQKPLPKDLIPSFTKEDDFWDFYDQSLPLP